jgi:hypothetical protein
VLYDGWHRVTARRRIAAEYPGRGYDELPADIDRAPDGREVVDYAYDLAVECSAIGSKQLTQSERRAAARRFRLDQPAREVAKVLGISHSTVVRAREAGIASIGANAPSSTASANLGPRHRARRQMSLEQRACQAADALYGLFDQARDETRGMLGLGKPNMARAGAAVYKALEHSYGEDAPTVTENLLALVIATQDQAERQA